MELVEVSTVGFAVVLAAVLQESGEAAGMPIVHVHHAAERCTCEGVYQCPACARLCGFCFGAYDEMPAVCDDCWSRYSGDELEGDE